MMSTRAKRMCSPGPVRCGLIVCVVAGLSVITPAQTRPAAVSWLDQPLASWNKAGAALSNAPITSTNRDAVMKTCDLKLGRSTPAERALADAGWIPFRNFDQQLVQGDIEIMDGMSGADGMCRPTGYNIFVFVGGGFAGTLSPNLMNSRSDASSGAVRILDADTISAEFVRYTDKDPLCCASSRVTVRYRIDRTGRQPVAMPLDVRVTRSL
jgi:LppP/LprE lipoprotein